MLISLGINNGQVSSGEASGTGLAPSKNLFTEAQSAFETSNHIDFRSNWAISDGRLTCLELSANEARLSLDEPLVSGTPYMAVYDLSLTAGSLKLQLSGDGLLNARAVTADWQGFQHYPSSEVAGNYPRVHANPSGTFSGSIDNVAVYDLSEFDPHVVACDVVIIGGDSNSTNTTSEFVDGTNRETAFDPRLWYMPCLRASPTYANVGCERHVPFPMIEPVVGAGSGRRMSPVHAAASRLVSFSAARNRPLLVMALGDAGSGLMTTEDWRHPDRRVGSGPAVGRMWDEMVAMKLAMDARGPAHEVIGAVWSLGQNDGFDAASAEAYDFNITPEYAAFFEDVRDLFGSIPMVMTNIAPHFAAYADANLGPGFGSHRQTWINRFDQDSGHANAISNFKVVQPVESHPVNPSDLSDPHYSAAGMQANGRHMGDALRGMLG